MMLKEEGIGTSIRRQMEATVTAVIERSQANSSRISPPDWDFLLSPFELLTTLQRLKNRPSFYTAMQTKKRKGPNYCVFSDDEWDAVFLKAGKSKALVTTTTRNGACRLNLPRCKSEEIH